MPRQDKPWGEQQPAAIIVSKDGPWIGTPARNDAMVAEQLKDIQYKDLRRILDAAYRYASEEKGHERHGKSGDGWSSQRHAAIAKEIGTGFAIGQAVKKAYESEGLEPDAAKRELLGAITYLASAIYAIERGWR
ncbi:MAG: hypothetical protein GEU78_10335 [Actinobacteria bacterium]|nr:hypothetical protein [Actinomycetota bacterium]